MFLRIFIASSLLVLSESCTCRAPNITLSYCRSDAVAHVTVSNVTTNSSDPFHGIEYGVDYVKVYRKTDKFGSVHDRPVVHTPPTGGGCGVAIDPKSKENEWVFFINVGHRQSYINICSPNQVWSKDIKSKLEGDLAKLNCTEIIKSWSYQHSRNTTDSKNATGHHGHHGFL